MNGLTTTSQLQFADSAGKFLFPDSTGRDDNAFSQMMATFMNPAQAEITPDIDGNTDIANKDILPTDDPYTESAVASSFSTLNTDIPTSEIRLTDSELHKIADKLRKDDPSAAARVDALQGHPGGSSVSEVVQAAAKQQPVKLDEADLAKVEHFGNEIDPSGGLASTLVSDLRTGNLTHAWDSLSSALKKLDTDSSFSLSKDSLLSLGKGLGISSDSLQQLTALFGKVDSLNLTTSGLKNMLDPMGKEVMAKAESRFKLAGSLEMAMRDVVKDARKRLEAEAQSAGLTSKRTLQSKTLIEDTVKKNGIDRQDIKQNAQKNVKEKTTDKAEKILADQDIKQEKDIKQDGKHAEKTILDQQIDNLLQKKNFKNSQDGSSFADNHQAKSEKKTESQLTQQSTKTTAWDTLVDRINLASGQLSPTQTAANFTSSANGRPASPYASQVLDQVQQGLLSALNDGTKRLELQLHPAELGAVSVLLTTRNGEVSALLRPERPETASLLMQQLGDLRAELEQQGLKVDKVDVQTQLQSDQGMTWQGLDQHNATRDQQDHVLAMDRLRRLSRISSSEGERISRMISGGSSSSVLEYASGGLHLVA